MDNIYTYFVKFPNRRIREAVMPCSDGGYTIYIDERLTLEQQIRAYNHAIRHIKNGDFDRCDVNRIELDAHAL